MDAAPPAAPRPDPADTIPDAPVAPELVGATCASHPEAQARVVCTRCGDYACADCIFSPLRGREVCARCAADGLPEPIPWERRKALGLRRAYWETTKAVLRDPTRFFKTPATEEGLLGPMSYGALAYTVGNALYAAVMAVLMLGGGGVSAAVIDEPEVGGFLLAYFGCLGLAIVPLTIVQAPVQALFGMILGGGAAHLTLMLLRSARGSFETTLRAVSYANAAYLFLGVPCVGLLIVPIYEIWAEVVGVREAHRTGTDRAVLAVLGYRVLVVLLVIAAYVAVFALTLASANAQR